MDKIEYRPLDYPKIWRIAQGKTPKPVRFGTCCSQVMGLFLDNHPPKYKDKREVIWDMAETMNKELLGLRDAGCRCIQSEGPTFHFMANTFGKDDEEIRFLMDAFNREFQGLDDVELWVHACWGNPNMQRAMEDTSYANSACRLHTCLRLTLPSRLTSSPAGTPPAPGVAKNNPSSFAAVPGLRPAHTLTSA